MEVIELARNVAREYHSGQIYETNGTPKSYFEGHLQPVANIVTVLGYDNKTIAAAYLHDVIEDTQLAEDDLTAEGIPNDVVEAVIALTHFPQESLQHYLGRISLVSRAIPVKFADSSMNLQKTLEGKDYVAPDRYQRLRAKYEYNLKFLWPILPSVSELAD